MSRYKVSVQHIPTLGPEEVIARNFMLLKLRALDIGWQSIKLTDNWYFAPSWEGCRKAIDYLMPRIPQKYLVDKFDCENFAGWFRHKAAELFGVNIFAEVEGLADVKGLGVMERHGWTVFTEGKHFYQLETQTGMVIDIDNPLYVPDEIVMG